MTRTMTARSAGRAAAIVLGSALLALAPAPVHAIFDNGSPGAGDFSDPELNRETVSIRIAPIGAWCVRVVEAVGYDPRLNRRLYRVALDSGPLVSLGVVAYQNAFASARDEAQARAAVAQAQRDAAPYRRDARSCG